MLSVFLVCFDSRNEGRLFSPHLKKEVAFSTLPDFLLMADRCCERVAISQRSTERSTVGKQLIAKSDSKQNILLLQPHVDSRERENCNIFNDRIISA